MGLFKKITGQIFSGNNSDSASDAKQALLRRCYFEVMEQRRVLSADPVIAAVTYLEGDLGLDTTPDHFEVSFEGGSDTTQLAQFTINGDQDLSGTLTDGDLFFDVNADQPGRADFHPFIFDAENSSGVQASDIRSISVTDNGLALTVELDNFEAGDVFAFTIDVDEVERFRTDVIASGVEFEGSFFEAQFVDEHFTFEELNLSVDAELLDGFVQSQQEGIFFDEFNALFAEAALLTGESFDLALDNETGQGNRTAGTVDAFELVERPVTIEGNVFHDENIDCIHDGTEEGIEGVGIELQRLNTATGEYETVANTVTDANGHYRFGEDLDIRPGTFRLIETQPDGFINVGEVAGSEGGTVSENVIADINIELGGTAATDYNFKEVRPASLSGNVFHDANDNGIFDADEDGIANVLIQVTRVSGKDGVTDDAFANSDPVFVRTDALGHYSVEQLPPGIYEIVEINNYSEDEIDPLADFIDGRDSIGRVNGLAVGEQANDRFSNVELCPDEHGEEFNFGELLPSSISGNVSVATPGSDPNDPTDPLRDPIEGVTLQLLDERGNLLETTVTDEFGNYEFAGLAPGTYSVVEVQPNGFLDASDHVGTVDGEVVGESTVNDRFDGIVLGSGQDGVRYDFCEHVPAGLSGTVFHDRNDDGNQDANDEGIEGVQIILFDSAGNQVAETLTDANGNYQFLNLEPGEYVIQEIQPTAFVDGQDTVGTINGETVGQGENDRFTNITLFGGQMGVQYDFGEILGASIGGNVHVDENGNSQFDDGDELLAGVTLELLDSDGNVVATTVTGEDGQYNFEGLRPGEYSIRQIQPAGFFTAGEEAGLFGGQASENLISGISVASGDEADGHNFCEHRPAEIHGRVFQDGPAFVTPDGLPFEGFRDQRDGVFQSGVDTPIEGVRLQLYFFSTDDSIVPRPVTLADVDASFYSNLGTDDPAAEIFVETDADGNYWFQGLQAGNYVVVQQQPSGFVDANDVVGSTTGFTFNNVEQIDTAPQSLLSTFSTDQLLDSVSNIRVEAGGASLFNNFTEVVFEAQDDPTFLPPIPQPPQAPPTPLPPGAGLTSFPGLLGAQTPGRTELTGNTRGLFETEAQAGGGLGSFTWHLSIVNGGQPRGVGEGQAGDNIWTQVGHLENGDWSRFDLDDGVWSFASTDEITGEVTATGNQARFGMIGGTPLAGDFDGDGIDEVASFKNGYWMIDINHNGRWDDGDLLARLGEANDRPVVGDWDGDGKDDIGIFGPIWEQDYEAIEREPGLPNPDNDLFTDPKNVPPTEEHATNGARVMQLTSHGSERADVVDHVFGVGNEQQVPVTGDWNGNGIRSIGTFEDGKWQLDVDGDGRFTSKDVTANFGQAGDIPLVGDFDGDGIEEIAIYRSGSWMIDSNGNHELDATDRSFQMGIAGDVPVVGDWDGDGVDDPALHRESQAQDFN